MIDFWKSKFFALCWDFDQETYEEGFSKGEQELREAILEHFLEIKLDFLDVSEGPGSEPIGASTKTPSIEPVSTAPIISELIDPVTTNRIQADPISTIGFPSTDSPAWVEPSVAINPNEEVEN